MADKDYKVQVGVEAKADTRGLDQVNKGLDKVRRTASRSTTSWATMQPPTIWRR